QHVLREVGGVGVLQTLPPREAVDERRVQVHELAPRRGVARVADADQQTGTGRRHVGHSRPLESKYGGRAPFYQYTPRISEMLPQRLSRRPHAQPILARTDVLCNAVNSSYTPRTSAHLSSQSNSARARSQPARPSRRRSSASFASRSSAAASPLTSPHFT